MFDNHMLFGVPAYFLVTNLIHYAFDQFLATPTSKQPRILDARLVAKYVICMHETL
jgi:hypothetical protein